MTYEDIKRLAAQAGRRVTDLIALAPKNDPFYVGKPAEQQWARWFAVLYRAFGYERGWARLRRQIHLRRAHYQIVSQESPVSLPNGKQAVREHRGLLGGAGAGLQVCALPGAGGPGGH